MLSAKQRLGAALLCLSVLAGCASPGEPLPPSLELAQPVSDFRASRKDDQVTLTWTTPTQTTDGRNLRHPGSVEICRSADAIHPCATVVGRVPALKTRSATPARQTYVDVLPAAPCAAVASCEYFYAVRVVNSYGRTAGRSNVVAIPAAPTLPPPTNFQAAVTSEGVKLSWDAVPLPSNVSGLRFVYRVHRQEAGSKAPEIAAQVPVSDEPHPSAVDQGFTWEHTYRYYATVATIIPQPNGSEQQVEGANTAPVTVVAHDVFPPATPTGLQAVFSGRGQKPFIDLVWNANTDPDLAGYNVYRHEAGTAPQKINPALIPSPAFRDNEVVPGHKYWYSVSAVDVRGNESPRSEQASETVPAQ